jgi:hypothetical protein
VGLFCKAKGIRHKSHGLTLRSKAKVKRKEARFTAPRTENAEDLPRTKGAEDKEVRGAPVNNYSFSCLIDSAGLLEKWNVASNIIENNARAIIPTMCQPLKIKFIPEATIPIMLAIFTFRFIILP